MENCVDTWIPLLPKYVFNPKRIAEAKARGKKIWWYVCALPNDHGRTCLSSILG